MPDVRLRKLKQKRQKPEWIYLRFLVFILFVLVLAYSSFSEIFSYNETAGKENRTLTYVVDKIGSGYEIRLVCIRSSDTFYTERYTTDSVMSVLHWQYREKGKQIEISGNRKGNSIYLTGHFRDKTVIKTENIDDSPWYQELPVILKELLRTVPLNSISFWAVGTDDPGAMKTVKFTASKKDTDIITVNTKIEDAIHIVISFTGIMSKVWHCDSWFRKDDGLFLVYKGKNSLLSPTVVTEFNSLSN